MVQGTSCIFENPASTGSSQLPFSKPSGFENTYIIVYIYIYYSWAQAFPPQACWASASTGVLAIAWTSNHNEDKNEKHTTSRRKAPTRTMRKGYLVCQGCKASWIWQERLQSQPHLACNICGTAWQRHVPDFRRQKQRQVQWASWNFTGARWPNKTYKEALLDAPPGLAGGAAKKKNKKGRQSALAKSSARTLGQFAGGLAHPM